MSNEELAVAIQGGQDLWAELWEQMKRLIYQLVCIAYNKRAVQCSRAGVELEDLLQCGFLALYDAVKAYDPEKGYKLSAFIKYPLQNHINAALGRRGSPEPLNESRSLEEPVPDAEDLTLADSIEDGSAWEAFESALDREYGRELHNVLFDCLDGLEDGQRRCILWKYFSGMDTKGIGEREGISPAEVKSLQAKGLRALRHPDCSKRLHSFLNEHAEAKAYHGTGFEAWKERGSVEERIAERYL